MVVISGGIVIGGGTALAVKGITTLIAGLGAHQAVQNLRVNQKLQQTLAKSPEILTSREAFVKFLVQQKEDWITGKSGFNLFAEVEKANPQEVHHLLKATHALSVYYKEGPQLIQPK